MVFQKLFTAKKLPLSNSSILNFHSDSTAGKASWKETSAFHPSLRHTVDILTQVKKKNFFSKLNPHKGGKLWISKRWFFQNQIHRTTFNKERNKTQDQSSHQELFKAFSLGCLLVWRLFVIFVLLRYPHPIISLSGKI